MTDTLAHLRQLLAKHQPLLVLQRLQQIFTLSESELLNDAILVSAQYHKLQSDRRKGILDAQQENLQSNRINYAIASLLDEIAARPEDFRGEDRVTDQLAESRADRGQGSELPAGVQGALLARITAFKKLGHHPRLLWLDDGPGDDPYEVKILKATGMELLVYHRSAEARQALTRGSFDLLVSDIIRGGKPDEGFRFLRELREAQLAPPTIFYISNFDPSRGVPPYAFGITHEPHELIHLVLDALERRYF